MSRILRSLLYAGLAILGFWLTSSAWRRAVPWPDRYGLRTKWEWLEENIDEIDTLFIGSSVTCYGIVPPLFDEVMAERGFPTRSFNLGAGAMMSIEADYVLRRVLELEPKNLRHVFIESNPWEGTLQVRDKTNLYSPRMVHWHDYAGTRTALESLENTPPPQGDQPDLRAEDQRTHALLYLRNRTSAGQGLRTVRRFLGLGLDELVPAPDEVEALRGYVDLDRLIDHEYEGAEWQRRRRDFLADQAGYKREVSQVGRNNRNKVDIANHRNLPALKAQIERVRAAGAEPRYYLGPRVASDPMTYRLAEEGILPTFYGFNRPGEYPEIYDPEKHFDKNHLNRTGSEAFTRLLAETFAADLSAANPNEEEGQ